MVHSLKLALSTQLETQQGCVFLLCHRKLATRCEHASTSANSRGLKKKPNTPTLSIIKVNNKQRKENDKRVNETDGKASMLTEAGGLERECCGEERTTGGIPLAGLVPGPLPPANWHRQKKEKKRSLIQTKLVKKRIRRQVRSSESAALLNTQQWKNRENVFMALTSK